MNSALRIVSWNCHSIYSKLGPFKIFLYSERPHIVCLCETWLKSSRLPSFINYSSFFKCRPDRAGGGLAILVRNDVNISPKQLIEYANSKLEVQAVTVHCERSTMDIMNIYNPNLNVSDMEFTFYFEQLSANKLILGDFNAHHPLWDTRHPENPTGNHLVQSLLHNPDLSVITPVNLNTYFHSALRQFSTLDLCIVSCNLVPQSSVQLGQDLGSDHSPIFTQLNFSPILSPSKRRPHWIFGNTNQWQKYISSLPLPIPTDHDSLESSYNSFTNTVTNSACLSFRKTKETVTPKFSTPWWNEECNDAIRHRRHCKNVFHRHPTAQNLTRLNRAEALARQTDKKG